MKKSQKKRIVAVVAVCVLIIAAGAAVLVNASKLNKIFDPKKFDRFENDLADSEEYDSIAGDGEESDLADDSEEGEDRSEGDSQKAREADEARRANLDKEEDDNPDSMKLATGENTGNDQANSNAFGLNENDDKNGIGVKPGNGNGNGADQGNNAGDGSGGNGGNHNNHTNTGDGSGTNGGNNGDDNDDHGSGGDDSWHDTQMSDKDPIITEDGELLSLQVKEPDNWVFCIGDAYSDKGVTVTATFRKNGKLFQKTIPYGGPNGYSVRMSTKEVGDYVAVFYYKGVTARVGYRVTGSSMVIKYGVTLESQPNKYYTADYPTNLSYSALKDVPWEGYEDGSVSDTVWTTSGFIADVRDAHHRMIAYLSDPAIEKQMNEVSGTANYKNVIHLTQENGYLSTFTTGFRKTASNTLQDTQSYVCYPMQDLGSFQQHLIDYVEKVPEGYKIKLEVSGTKETYKGEQVLVGYSASDAGETYGVLEVPMGVTKIAIEEGTVNTEIKSIVIPESVETIDYQSISKYFPNLEEYRVTGTSCYKVVDGVLYSQDGKTLLSVPAGKKQIEKWSDNVDTISTDAFAGCEIDKVELPVSVEHLSDGCFKGAQITTLCIKGENMPSGIKGAEYKGKILVKDSEHDVICKKCVFSLEGTEGITVGVMDESGQEIAGKTDIYQYDTSREILVLKSEPQVLAGISPKKSGKYVLPDGITSIADGAFATGTKVHEVEIPDSVKELRAGSLAALGNIESVTIKGTEVTASKKMFGEAGSQIPQLTVYVPEEAYDEYVENWSQALDPTYGKDTAKKLLAFNNDQFLYEGGAKYKVLKDIFGRETYQLIEVYDTDVIAFTPIEQTVGVADGAFSKCPSLEIVYLPDTVEKVTAAAFEGCEALETVMIDTNKVPAFTLAGAAVYVPDDTYKEYLYEGGIVYGKMKNGAYTLLNVPTDYSGTLNLREKTEYLAKEACKDCTLLTDITSPDRSLKEIGDYCFENCTGIKIMDFDSYSSLSKVGAYAFKGCTNMEQMSVAHAESIGEGICYDCINLKLVSLTSAKEFSDRCFYNCQSLSASDIHITLDKIISIGEEAFAYCESMQSFGKIPNVKSIGARAFMGCSGLRAVELSDVLESMEEECFRDCVLLKSVDLNGKLSGISRYCFYGCRNLEKVTLNSQQEKALEFVGVQAFAQCCSLEEIDWAALTSLTQIGNGAFTGCQNLMIVKLPDSLTDISEQCFSDCGNLSMVMLYADEPVSLGNNIFGNDLLPFVHVYVEAGRLETYEKAFSPVLDGDYGDGTAKKVLDIIDENKTVLRGVTYVYEEGKGRILLKASPELSGEYTVLNDTTEIADEAFKDCKKLTAIELPVQTEIRLGDRCFIGCDNLERASLLGNIPEWGTEVFMNCKKLNYVQIGQKKDCVVARIGTRAFKGCTGLAGDAASPDTVSVSLMARIGVIGEESFAGCSNLGVLGVVSDVFVPNLKEIEDEAFAGCSKLYSFLTSKYTGLTAVGARAFKDCDTFRSPSIPKNVTSLGEGCFEDCASLTTVSVYGALEEYPKDCFKNCPKLTRTGGTAAALNGLRVIGESAYEGCVSLTNNTSWHPGKYTGLQEIGANAFKGCTNFTGDIQISGTVTSIGEGAFDGCSGIDKLVLSSDTPPVLGTMDLATLADSFGIRVPDSEASGDSVYLAYREMLTGLFDEDTAYRILDSVSDGARVRNPLVTRQKIVNEVEPEAEAEQESDTDIVDTVDDTQDIENMKGGEE